MCLIIKSVLRVKPEALAGETRLHSLHYSDIFLTMTKKPTKRDIETARELLEFEKLELRLHENLLAASKLEAFIKETMPTFEFEWYHYEMFDKVERVIAGEIKKLMIFISPRVGKSEVVSKRLPAFYLGNFPDRKVICASHTATLAEGFGRKTRNIVKSYEYKLIFPNFRLADDKSTAGDWETKEEGGYYSVGVGGSILGRGAHLAIIDDPISSRQDAESETYRERLWDWYHSDLYTRLMPKDSAIILMHQRWHPHDLAGRLIEEEGLKKDGGEWEVVSFPAIEEGRDPKYLSNKRGFGEEFYESRKKTMPVRDFASMYQQDPIEASGRGFSPKDYRYFAMSDVDPKDFTFAVHVDPAFSSRPESDDTAVIVMARQKVTGELYVLDVFAYTMIPSEAYNYIFSLIEKWKSAGWTFDFISIEDVTLNVKQQLFISGFNDKMKEERKFYTVLPFRPAGRGIKLDRIKFALEPMFSNHALYFRNDDKSNPAWKKLEEQVLQFPNCKRLDVIDVLAQGVIVWNEREVTNFEDEKKSFKKNVIEVEDLFADL